MTRSSQSLSAVARRLALAALFVAAIPALGAATEFTSALTHLPADRLAPILVQNRPPPNLLKRRDPTPPTLRPTLSSANPEGDGVVIRCRATSRAGDLILATDPRATPSTCVVAILDVLELSLDFARGPVELVVTAPNGSQHRSSLPEPESFGTTNYEYMAPGTALGTYTVVATGGGRTLRGGYTVDAQTRPILRVRANDPADAVQPWQAFNPGDAVSVDLAGYAPGSVVRFYLYRGIPGRMEQPRRGGNGTTEAIFEFAAEIGQMRLDRRGEGSFAIETRRDDPQTQYMVLSDPRQQGDQWDWNARFSLENLGHHE
jgi:hypothetical protein